MRRQTTVGHAVSRGAPELPPGEVRAVPGRGELFVRRAPGPAAVPVLLIHGWQATADLNFHALYGPVARAHPVIAADLRGHGRSLYPPARFALADAADDHAALLDDLGIPEAIVVGYSLGSAVAQTLVQRHPRCVAGLVLAAGELAPSRRLHEKLYNRLGGWMGTGQRLTSGRWTANRLVTKAVGETSAVESLRPWLVVEMERGHTGSVREAGRALGRFDGRAIAARHQGLPTAVVVTRRDRLVRPERQEVLASAWRARAFHLDADHDAPVAQPDAFSRVMLEAIEFVAAELSAAATSAAS